MLFIVQNDPEVPAGTYGAWLTGYGIAYATVSPHAGEALPGVERVTAAIVLGGAMGVHDKEEHPFLEPLGRWLVELVDRGIPLLGICLGGQLLASVLGARVIAGSPHGEKGMLTVRLTGAGGGDPLFAGVPEDFPTFQWHNDSFEIPAGALRLAGSAACPNQAFRYGQNAWGVQFHPEVDRRIIDGWARWTKETSARLDDFLSSFDREEARYLAASRRILDNFLRIARLGADSGDTQYTIPIAQA